MECCPNGNEVWIYNSFDLDVEDTGNEAGVIFLAAAMMSHSCAPNAAWHLDDSNSFILHARTDINDGEEVTISYLSPADLGLPTEDRRALLESTKGFVCGCERCVTPLDPARSFCCPCCDGEALARVRPGGDPEPGNDADVLVCSACGPLDASKAAPALQVEEEMKQWARSRPEFATLAKEEGAVAAMAFWHWIVDALRLAAASRLPSEASGLLRKCLEVQKGVKRLNIKCCMKELRAGEMSDPYSDLYIHRDLQARNCTKPPKNGSFQCFQNLSQRYSCSASAMDDAATVLPEGHRSLSDAAPQEAEAAGSSEAPKPKRKAMAGWVGPTI
ncbi:Protein msta, isoform B [Symbiodinium microadriaticum]|uniref:Protein msta, isoform B n=1 Tax=Symbiodinium microadriaticum TaxID=2951 RepID=A0A1Q9DVT3_SYMMI|nr:Protein msta, isoform B [Symbiodinium microadriaticum]